MMITTNADRAKLALPALVTFAEQTRHLDTERDMHNPAARDEAAADLIANLCHLVAAAGISPYTVLIRAYWYYLEELVEQLGDELHDLSQDRPGSKVAELLIRRSHACASVTARPRWRLIARHRARKTAERATGQLINEIGRIVAA